MKRVHARTNKLSRGMVLRVIRVVFGESVILYIISTMTRSTSGPPSRLLNSLKIYQSGVTSVIRHVVGGIKVSLHLGVLRLRPIIRFNGDSITLTRLLGTTGRLISLANSLLSLVTNISLSSIVEILLTSSTSLPRRNIRQLCRLLDRDIRSANRRYYPARSRRCSRRRARRRVAMVHKQMSRKMDRRHTIFRQTTTTRVTIPIRSRVLHHVNKRVLINILLKRRKKT